ncbi:MAG: hypothetical protein ACYDAI_12600 [Trichloromonadaceae bacterium]
MTAAEKGQEQAIMGRPPIFEKAKSKPISASEGFWKDMQTLADKLQNAGTPGGGNVSRMIRDIFNPMIEDHLSEEERASGKESVLKA